MRKLLLVGLFLLLGFSQANAQIIKTLNHQLTTGGSVVNGQTVQGSPIIGTTIGFGLTITSDSLYQAGSPSYGYSAVALSNVTSVTGANANIKLSYQVSYDNQTWFTPSTTTGNGQITVVSTLDSNVGIGNTWVVYNYTVYPYIRFNFQNNAATNDSITAETVWQDWL